MGSPTTSDPTVSPTTAMPTVSPTTANPTTSIPTRKGSSDSSSDSESDEDLLAAAAEALNGVLHDAGDDAVVADDLDVQSLQISLSPTALANLWGMAVLCIVGNLVAYFCFCRRTKKSVSFGQNGGQDQYISDQ